MYLICNKYSVNDLSFILLELKWQNHIWYILEVLVAILMNPLTSWAKVRMKKMGKDEEGSQLQASLNVV